MNRACLIVVGALLAGCTQHSEQVASSASPATAPAPGDHFSAPGAPAGITSHTMTSAPADHAGPGAPIPPPVASTPIYELSQDGKIYVFAFVDHMLAFQHAGKAQPVVIEKPDFTAKHTTVVIEAPDDAMAAEILASYLKQHPDSKK